MFLQGNDFDFEARGRSVWSMKTQLRSSARWALVAAGVWMVAQSLHAGPIQHPKRLVEGYTVDLTPLFRWWTNQTGVRPLSAWVRVTGPILATNSLGWVVAAHPDHPSARAQGGTPLEPPADGQWRIILKHPPLAEAAEFAALQTQLAELNAEHDRLDAAIKAASQPHLSGRRARVQAAELRDPKAQLQALNLQIRDCRAKLAAFPDPAKYKVDCLALDVGQEHGNLPVYDCGKALNESR
jgi:hypothetical protein